MRKYYCDRCGKEFNNSRFNQGITTIELPYDKTEDFELCEQCTNNFYDIIKKWKKKKLGLEK